VCAACAAIAKDRRHITNLSGSFAIAIRQTAQLRDRSLWQLEWRRRSRNNTPTFPVESARTKFMNPRPQVTLLLRSAKNGSGQRDERAADTLQPTRLGHDDYTRLSQQSP
jgi:hypothetical protein